MCIRDSPSPGNLLGQSVWVAIVARVATTRGRRAPPEVAGASGAAPSVDRIPATDVHRRLR
eukprot:10918440-Alexandrium_andersonii.AAC.1